MSLTGHCQLKSNGRTSGGRMPTQNLHVNNLFAAGYQAGKKILPFLCADLSLGGDSICQGLASNFVTDECGV